MKRSILNLRLTARYYLASVIYLVFSITLNAQCPSPNCVGAKILNISTGIDASGAFLAAGSIDPFWKLVNNPPLEIPCTTPPTVTIPNANVVAGLSAYPTWLNLNGSGQGLLSANITNAMDCDNLFSTQPWRFRRNFCVCKQTTVTISGDARMDDLGKISIYSSSGGAALFTASVSAGHIYSNQPFSGTITLPAGSYFLEAELENHGHHYCGLVIKGTITTSNNQNTLFSSGSSCCANNGIISVQKILETVNCNGKVDAGESSGVGWVFNLLNTSGTTLQTQTSNSTGEAIFSGLAAGTYTVVEQSQAGWTCSSPAGGTQQVVLAANGVATVSFYNCKEKIPAPKVCCPELKNLVVNPDFATNTAINSSYQFIASTAADAVTSGQYSIVNSTGATSICKNWIAPDHTTCTGTGTVMVVNGRTGQTGKKEIWRQTVSVQADKSYSFCGNFRNMAACCFDVQPKVDVRFSIGGGGYDILNEAINESPGCNWRLLQRQFNSGSNTSITISVWLDESGIGDGNDLAMDDFSFYEIPQINSSFTLITFTHTAVSAGTYGVTATATNPVSEPECGYFWDICEIDASNNCINGTQVSNPHEWWKGAATPNSFPGYPGNSGGLGLPNPGVFQVGKIYRVSLGTYCSCASWNQSVYKFFFNVNGNFNVSKI